MPQREQSIRPSWRRAPYLILLADREKAKLFRVVDGEVTAQTEIVDGQVPQRVKAIREEGLTGRDDHIARHIEDHLHRHLSLIAEATEHFLRNHPVSFIVLGGHQELFTKIKRHLPRPLRSLIAGEFVTELKNVTTPEIVAQGREVAQAAHYRPRQSRR